VHMVIHKFMYLYVCICIIFIEFAKHLCVLDANSNCVEQFISTQFDTLQHTTTHCNTLQYSTAHSSWPLYIHIYQKHVHVCVRLCFLLLRAIECVHTAIRYSTQFFGSLYTYLSHACVCVWMRLCLVFLLAVECAFFGVFVYAFVCV